MLARYLAFSEARRVTSKVWNLLYCFASWVCCRKVLPLHFCRGPTWLRSLGCELMRGPADRVFEDKWGPGAVTEAGCEVDRLICVAFECKHASCLG